MSPHLIAAGMIVAGAALFVWALRELLKPMPPIFGFRRDDEDDGLLSFGDDLQ